MRIHFPDRFGDSTELEFFSRLKRLVELELEILQDEDRARELGPDKKAIEDYFHSLNVPRIFTPNKKENIVVLIDNSFEDVCCTLEDNGAQGVKLYTVYEFFKRIEYYERKFKEKE